MLLTNSRFLRLHVCLTARLLRIVGSSLVTRYYVPLLSGIDRDAEDRMDESNALSQNVEHTVRQSILVRSTSSASHLLSWDQAPNAVL